MSFNPVQFADLIVVPTLQTLDSVAGIPYTKTAFDLVMGTLAQESLLGTWLVQQNGDALGIGQIEPASLSGLVASLTPAESRALAMWAMPGIPSVNVVTSLPYAVAITRLFYWKIPAALPADTITALFEYYKQWYNTPAGAATLQQWQLSWMLTGISLPLS
jgi:hypothetical protein